MGSIFLWAAIAGGILFLLVLAYVTCEEAWLEHRAKLQAPADNRSLHAGLLPRTESILR